MSTDEFQIAVPGAAGAPAGAPAAALRPRLRLRLSAEAREAVRTALGALVGTRLLVWGVGVVALLVWGNTNHGRTFDPPGLTHGLGRVADVLVGPAARWDAAWYLSIADIGYTPHALFADGRSAFFPLYPLLSSVLGSVTGIIAAGVLVSMGAFAVALYLTHRLAALELGGQAPRLAVMATALFPMSFFFSAIYSESLYLALSLGAFWLARRGRWAPAAAAVALASATRSSGILLGVGLAVLYLYGPRADRPPDHPHGRRLTPRYRLRADALWLGLVPVGLVAFMAYLALIGGDAFAPFHAQTVWYRHFAGPFLGVWDGAVAAFDGARQLWAGTQSPVYFTDAGGDPLVVAQHNVMLFCFLIAAVPAVLGVLRRLPAAYGVYLLAALALPLSYPVGPQPLMSLPRFLAALFPLHLWSGDWLARHPRARWPAALLSGGLLVFFTGAFSTWHWVA
ncbi:MAG: hypothetical protein E6G56_13960 [Actinobacteria bacterium]|nr:MAG: hypothetical protein E6G56_13960 [Actinomycetota bacterium]